MFVDGECITFWFGSIRPESANLARVDFPVRVTSVSVAGLHAIELTIPGFAYLDSDGAVRYVERDESWPN